MAEHAAKPGLPAKLTLAACSTVLTLLALEAGWRVFRGSAPGESEVPDAATAAERVDARRLYRDLSGRIPITGETFNVYYLGGSTMASSHFVALIDRMLGSRVDGRPMRSLIVAADGQDLRYNQVRARVILDQGERFHPDLFVVYSGHNEFLKFHGAEQGGVVFGRHYAGVSGRLARHSLLAREILDRFHEYRLEIDERRFFDEPLFERESYDVVLEAYRYRLATLARWLGQEGIPLIVSTVAGNCSDWEPNRSIYCEDAGDDQEEFLRWMDEGARHHELRQFESAVGAFRSALRICPTFAEAHYRLGESLRSLGREDEAWDAFAAAVDHDGMPVRATSKQNDFIRELGASGRAHVVDAVGALRRASGDGLIGFDLMVDGHHPNERGYGLIAELIVRKIAELFPDGHGGVRVLDHDGLVQFFDRERPRRAFEFQVGRGRWFTRLATWRYDPTRRLDNAEQCFLAARDVARNRYEPYLGLAVVSYLRKETESGDEYLQAAMQRDPERVSEYLARPWIESVVRRAHEAD
jgi:tetratricopeptide (TPR) repeat protein